MNNVKRDVMTGVRRCSLLGALPEPYVFNAPDGAGGSVRHMCFLPHEVYSKLKERGAVARSLLPAEAIGSAEGLGSLVGQWCDSNDVAGNPDPSMVAPFGLHADGFQYTSDRLPGGARSVVAFSWNCLCGADADVSVRFVFRVAPKPSMCICGCSGHHNVQGSAQSGHEIVAL